MNPPPPPLPEVTAVRAQPDHTLLLEFDTGEQRVFDFRPCLTRKPFLPLADPTLFAEARVENGTVGWPGDIDIAPETLYARSVPVQRQPQMEMDPVVKWLRRITWLLGLNLGGTAALLVKVYAPAGGVRVPADYVAFAVIAIVSIGGGLLLVSAARRGSGRSGATGCP
jgi:hypothetical protein